MKLNLLVLLASGVVAMGLLLGASTTQAQTEHLIAIYGLVLIPTLRLPFLLRVLLRLLLRLLVAEMEVAVVL